MDIGAFSISLAVSDMTASRDFYKQLGFEMIGGDGENWTITINESKVMIGLFQGMFDSNIMTFNPGFGPGGDPLESFIDVREIVSTLKSAGIGVEADTTVDSDSGPASFTISDPDGNLILVDQHV